MSKEKHLRMPYCPFYLKVISKGNMNEALYTILGEHAKGFSATNISRLTQCWQEEYKERCKHDLSDKEYVYYFWIDRIYFNVRLTDDNPCSIFIIGALSNKTKEMATTHDGQRESKLYWKTVLQELKLSGLKKKELLGTHYAKRRDDT